MVKSVDAVEVGVNSQKRVGVLGGTFNPIHLGHLAAAQEARETLCLDQVLFVPSGYPPHKRIKDLVPIEMRYVMTSLACASNPAFVVSRVDIDTQGPTYTVDTLSRLQEQIPASELFFISGTDMFLDLPNWRNPEEILGAHHFVVVSRPGWDSSQVTKLVEQKWSGYSHHIHILQVPGVAISATEIRRRVQTRKSIRYLVPDAVADYIAEHELYV